MTPTPYADDHHLLTTNSPDLLVSHQNGESNTLVEQRKAPGFLQTSLVESRCFGGGKKMLNILSSLFTVGTPSRSRARRVGAKCVCGRVWQALVFTLLASPVLGMMAYVRMSGGAFLGAFSLFAVPPLIYVHLVWYFSAGHLVTLFDEVCLYGPVYTRAAERVIRRQFLIMAIAIPTAAIVMSIMFFSTNPLVSVFNRSPLAILGIALVPFFFLSLLVLGVPIVFAGSFSITWALIRIVMERYASIIAADRRSVNDALTMHITLLRKIDSHISHWRAGYTLGTVLSLTAIFLIFWSMTNTSTFIAEMIPFAIFILVCACCLQFYFFYVISSMSRACSALRITLLEYEMALPSDSVERLLIAVHSTTHRAHFFIFGFYGNLVVDAVMCVMLVGIFVLFDTLVG